MKPQKPYLIGTCLMTGLLTLSLNPLPSFGENPKQPAKTPSPQAEAEPTSAHPQDGPFTRQHSNGTKAETGKYLKGIKVGTWTRWNQAGQKISEFNFNRAGDQHGSQIHWYPTGKKKQEGNFTNGLRNGAKTEWYSTGKKKAEIHYQEGKVHGIEQRWLLNGEAWWTAKWKDGKQIEPYLHEPLERGQGKTKKKTKGSGQGTGRGQGSGQGSGQGTGQDQAE